MITKQCQGLQNKDIPWLLDLEYYEAASQASPLQNPPASPSEEMQ